MKEEFHWFPLYYQRFMLGTIGFSTEEIGAYILLLFYQWDNYFVPDDGDKITEICRISFSKCNQVLKKFEKKKNGFQNKFLEQVRKEQRESYVKRVKSASNAGKASAAKRNGRSTTVERPLNDCQPIEKNRIEENREENNKEEKRENINPLTNFSDFEKLEKVMMKQETWIEWVCRDKKISREKVLLLITEFIKKLSADGERNKVLQDAQKHFNSWIPYYLKNEQENTTSKKSQTTTQDDGF